jgi:hypothetical protein
MQLSSFWQTRQRIRFGDPVLRWHVRNLCVRWQRIGLMIGFLYKVFRIRPLTPYVTRSRRLFNTSCYIVSWIGKRGSPSWWSGSSWSGWLPCAWAWLNGTQQRGDESRSSRHLDDAHYWSLVHLEASKWHSLRGSRPNGNQIVEKVFSEMTLWRELGSSRLNALARGAIGRYKVYFILFRCNKYIF